MLLQESKTLASMTTKQNDKERTVFVDHDHHLSIASVVGVANYRVSVGIQEKEAALARTDKSVVALRKLLDSG